MKFTEIWSGKLPPYWDVTPWHCLTDHYLAMCYREIGTKRRVLQIIDFAKKNTHIQETIFNVIIGNQHENLYLGRITDRRTHAQITRVSKYGIIDCSVLWSINDTFLVEKYKIPFMYKNSTNYSFGNKAFDLRSGEVEPIQNTNKQFWILTSNRRLEQQGRSLYCLDTEGRTLWFKENVYGNWYQGVSSNTLFLLLPNSCLVLIDVETGCETEVIDLIDLKRVKNRLNGTLDVRNDLSFDSSTIFDVLINDNFVAWINTKNELVVYNRSTLQLSMLSCCDNDDELLVSNINSRSILLYAIGCEDCNKMLLVDLEGNVNGESFVG